jgi:3-carboxy-cis,cis-muconate cycloisomerase
MMTPTLLNSIFYDETIAQEFSDEPFVQYMLRFEVALAQVESRMGIIPLEASKAIEEGAVGLVVDYRAIRAEMEKSSIPTIALIKQLREAVGENDGSYLHWGATSQDVMDTALVLQLKACIEEIEPLIQELIQQLGQLADKHRHTLMAGRSHSQQALPITFGFKVANWIAPLLRHRQRLKEIKPRLLMLQFGGAVGTLASLDKQGLEVAKELAKELGLGLPAIAWHNQRDNLAEFASWLSLLTGSLAKMAQDIILMAQSEIAELMETSDSSRGGSSTMPQKQNPIISEIILAAARQNTSLLSSMHAAMVHEHERATGNWQLEWVSLPQMLHLSMTALKKAVFLSQNLVVNLEQMQANVKASNGLMLAEAIELAIAPFIGRTEAKNLIKASAAIAIEERRNLVDIVRERLDLNLDWDSLRDESHYVGHSEAFINRVLAEINI